MRRTPRNGVPLLFGGRERLREGGHAGCGRGRGSSGRSRSGGRGPRERLDVRSSHDAVATRARHEADVDAELAGETPGAGDREHLTASRCGRGCGCSRDAGTDELTSRSGRRDGSSRGRGGGGLQVEDDVADRNRLPFASQLLDDDTRRGRGDFDRGLVGHHLDDRLVFFDRRALRDEPLHNLAFGDALADVGKLELEDGSTAAATRRGGGRSCGGRGRSRRGRRGGSRRRRGAGATALDVEDHGTDRDRVAFSSEELRHLTRGGRRDLDGRLVGHHLDDGLVFLDGIAFADEPLDDLAFGNAFPDVRQFELDHFGLR